MITGDFLIKVVVAGFAAVGIEEWLKNFLPEGKPRLYALLMLPLSAGCFFAAHCLPLPVIGSVLTAGSVQIAYETLIQGFRAAIGRIGGKLDGGGGHPPPH